MSMLNIIGACCRQGQKRLGVNLGPLRIIDTIKKIYPINYSLISSEAFDTNVGYMTLYNKHLLLNNKKIITLGGDHSIGAFSVASSLYKYGDKLKILWIDAHADLNTRKSSKTKNTHGMPVASLLGLDNVWDINLPIANSNQIIYMGLRDVDPFEKQMISKYDITSYYMKDMKNINKIMDSMNDLSDLEDKINLII